MDAIRKLKNAVDAIEKAKRSLNSAKHDTEDDTDIVRAIRELDDAQYDIERALRDLKD